jgi:hypothetical protein
MVVSKVKKYFLATLFLFACAQAMAQSEPILSEGMISYNITYKDLPEDVKKDSIYLPTNLYALIKGTRTRMELKTLMGPKVLIVDESKKTNYYLTELMGMKTASELNLKDAERMFRSFKLRMRIDKVEMIKYDSVKVTRMGYECHPVYVIYTIEGKPFYLKGLYTKQIRPTYNLAFNNGFETFLDGTLLEYEVLEAGYVMIFTATNVEPMPVKDEYMEVGSDYTIIPMMGGR